MVVLGFIRLNLVYLVHLGFIRSTLVIFCFIRSIATYSGRKETAVYATDVRTGVVIRCKVFIDNFSRIQIFHNSIKLDLDGLATLRVRAFDSEGGFNFEINLSYLVLFVSGHEAILG